MSSSDLDARLRRIFAGTDTAPGFEARVMSRVAALPVVPVEELRLRYERHRREARERLRREAWFNTATAIGVGAAAIALIWRKGPALASWMDAFLAASSGPGALTSITILALGVGLWAAFGRIPGRL